MQIIKKEIQEKWQIDNIYPISNITLKREKIYLFYSEKEKVDYSLYTDGNLNHIDTWIDKRPSQRDIFLCNSGKIKRLEFLLEDANFLLIDKKYQDKRIRNLYIDLENFENVVYDGIYQVSINEKENLKIKRLEK